MDALRDTVVISAACFSAACLYLVGMVGLFCTALFTVALATSPIWVPVGLIAALIWRLVA
jgi:hypothetical protein